MKVTHDEGQAITAALIDYFASGRRIISRAAGRWGDVASISPDGWLRIRLYKPFPDHCYGVTHFMSGDKVELVEREDGSVLIRNVMLEPLP